MDTERLLRHLRAWFARQGWHLGSILPPARTEPWDGRPPVIGIGYDERGRRTLFPLWLTPEVTPRLLEHVDYFRRRWTDYGPLWPVPVEHVVPIVGALRWSETGIRDLTHRGIQPLTAADTDVWALMEAAGSLAEPEPPR